MTNKKNKKSKIDILAEYLTRGNEFEAIYKGVEYLIARNIGLVGGYYIATDDRPRECVFEDIEEFKEKATIGGDLLKDIFDDLEFTSGSDGDFFDEIDNA